MSKLTLEQRQHLIDLYSAELDALNESPFETMSFYDLELNIERTGQRILAKTLETLANNQNARISPLCPKCHKKAHRNGTDTVKISTLFGEIPVQLQRVTCLSCKKSSSQLKNPSLDNSGFSPALLERVIHLCVHQTFEEASQTLALFTWKLNDARLERVTSGFAQEALSQVRLVLETQAFEPLVELKAEQSKRVTILEADGVFVLGRSQDKTESGCPGREIKMALVHTNGQYNRSMVADHSEIDLFEPLVHGLLRQAGHRHGDLLVGIGDGGTWVQRLFENVGALRILDVYHALAYLEVVMVALGWNEELRLEERKLWCSGVVDGLSWLKTFDTGEQARVSWKAEALTAWAYLERFSKLGAMAYPSFKAQGLPIGSGEMEGANKAVIGSRMKRGGMHWSRRGARRMSCLRAQVKSRVCAYDFHLVRHQAFQNW